MKITVLLFASLADAVGARELEVELPGAPTVADALDALVRKHHAIAQARPSLAAAVNARYAAPATTLRQGDVLALLPPVSGG